MEEQKKQELGNRSLTSEFVPYELALRMKQLGFNKPCLFAWCNKGGWNKYTGKEEPIIQVLRTDGNPFGDFFEGKNWNIEVVHNTKNSIQCSAPLYQQAFRWFREKYDLFTHIEKGENPINFYLIIDNVSHKYNPKLWFDTYEEAELACLEKLIEIVESKSE